MLVTEVFTLILDILNMGSPGVSARTVIVHTIF